MRLAQIVVLSAFLAMACTSMDATNATSRPTYTPYPTFTPESLLVTTSSAEISTRLADPGQFVELEGRRERFSGTALSHAKEGIKEFKRGRYLLAIESFKKSQRHRDDPSYVLENWTGLAYRALGRYAEAIEHYSASIEVEDNSTGRVNRGSAYLFDGSAGHFAPNLYPISHFHS